MKRFAAMLLLSVFSLAAGAASLPTYPFVHVSGSAYMTVTPDQGSIDFELVVVAPTIDEAMATFAERSKTIQAVTAQHGIAPEDIELGEIKRTVAKDGVTQELKLTAHINVRVLAAWVPLVQGLVAIPNLEGFVTEFSTSEREKVVDQLTLEALQDAQRRAGLLAKGVGRRLGPAGGVSTGQLKNLGNAMGLVPSDFRERSPSTARPFRDIDDLLTISALKWTINVDVVYRLK